MADKTEDLESLKQALQSLEQDLRVAGGWSEVGGGKFTSPTLKRHLEVMEKVRDLLEAQVLKDQELLSQLHTQVQQMKHGGNG